MFDVGSYIPVPGDDIFFKNKIKRDGLNVVTNVWFFTNLTNKYSEHKVLAVAGISLFHARMAPAVENVSQVSGIRALERAKMDTQRKYNEGSGIWLVLNI